MSVKIRLARHGKKKRPFYRIIVTDSRNPRDGRFIDVLGTYNPIQNPAKVQVNQVKTFQWLSEGAELSGTVERILKKSGVFSRYEAMRGGVPLQEDEEKISMEIFSHELDEHNSKRKGKRRVVSGPAEETAVASPAETTEAPAETAKAPAETTEAPPAETAEAPPAETAETPEEAKTEEASEAPATEGDAAEETKE